MTSATADSMTLYWRAFSTPNREHGIRVAWLASEHVHQKIFANYLEAIADPDHEEHTDLLEWNGPFDPEAFNAKEATCDM